jgi:hypothetical protein
VPPHAINLPLQAAGIAIQSFCSDMLKDRTLTAEEDYVLKWSTISLCGGAETVGEFETIIFWG